MSFSIILWVFIAFSLLAIRFMRYFLSRKKVHKLKSDRGQ